MQKNVFQIRVWEDEHCIRCLPFMDQSGRPVGREPEQQERETSPRPQADSGSSGEQVNPTRSSLSSTGGSDSGGSAGCGRTRIENMTWSGDSEVLAASLDNDINIWNKGKEIGGVVLIGATAGGRGLDTRPFVFSRQLLLLSHLHL